MIFVNSHVGPLPNLDGEFKIGARLGEGGGGSVYEATQISLQRPVAVKRLHPWRTKGAEQRFRDEATLMGRVAHPNIVSVLMHGDLDGAPALVMERVDGLDLGSVLAQLRNESAGPSVEALAAALGSEALPWPDATPWWKVAASLVAQVGRALDHAHRCGVLHRDIKPSNVLLSKSGVAQLTDFGIALPDSKSAELDGPDAQPQGLRVEATSGNLAYCSPEELDGLGSTTRSDSFSLGLVARELISLEACYPDQDDSVAARILSIAEGEIRPMGRHFPAELRAVLDTAVAYDPADRYASVDDFARDLESACAGRAVSVKPETRARRTRRWWSRHGVTTAALAGLAVLLAGVPVAIQSTRLSAAKRVQASASAARDHLELAVDEIGDLLVNVAAASLKGQPLAETQRTLLLASGASLGRELSNTLLSDSSDESGATQAEQEDEIALRVRTLRARSLTNLVDAERRVGNFVSARQHIEELRSFRHRIPQGAVAHLGTRLQLHEAIMALAEGDFANAGELAAEALDDIEDAEALDDPLKKYRSSLWNARVEAALARADWDAAIEYGEEAVSLGRAWLEEAEPKGMAITELSRVLSNYAAALVDSNQHDEAEAPLREALELLERVPRSSKTESIEAILWNNIGSVEHVRGRQVQAEEAARRALDIQEAHLAAHPRSLFKRFAAARTHFRIGLFLIGQEGRQGEQEAHFHDARTSALSLCEMPSPPWQHFYLLGQVEYQLGRLSGGRGDMAEAHRRFERAVTALSSAKDGAGGKPEALNALLTAWKYYAGYTLSVEGEAGVSTLLLYRDEFPTDVRVQCNVASMLCQLAIVARGSEDVPSEELLRRIDGHYALALECLGAAVDLGGLTLEAIESFPKWKPLLDHPGYEAIEQRFR